MYEWAKVGAKVVCINDTDCANLLVKDKIYTISRCYKESHILYMGTAYQSGIVVDLEEVILKSPIAAGINILLQNFNILRFKPLVEKKLPSSLTSLLNDPDKHIELDSLDINASRRVDALSELDALRKAIPRVRVN